LPDPDFTFDELSCESQLQLCGEQRRLATCPNSVGNIGPEPCATQREICHCAVKGVPAKPQYPLRGSDVRKSLVSHRHIMQPDPWQRKKCPLIW
jgi:hypothetical protein